MDLPALATELRCANHPNEPTSLRCGKCDKPICLKCMHYTPVGIRCRECANLKPLPTFVVSPAYYLRGLAAGLFASAIAGALWGLFPAFGFWFALIMGFGVGETVSWAANRKRGPGLQMVAGVAVVAGIGISRLLLFSRVAQFGLTLPTLAFMGIAVLLAVIRLK